MIKPFLCALSFLTIIPISRKVSFSNKDYANAVLFFPVVGIVVALFVHLLTFGAASLYLLADLHDSLKYSRSVVNKIWLVFLGGEALITGLLHWDGFSDSVDGFLSGKGKADVMKIMEDSRAGAKGVFVTIFMFLVLANLWANWMGHLFWSPSHNLVFKHSAFWPMAECFIVICLLSRMAMACGLAFYPYVRPGGLGEGFAECGRKRGRLTVLLTLLILVLLARSPVPFLSLLFVVATLLVWGWYCKKRIGGMTGDTLGALCILSEAAALVAYAFFVF